MSDFFLRQSRSSDRDFTEFLSLTALRRPATVAARLALFTIIGWLTLLVGCGGSPELMEDTSRMDKRVITPGAYSKVVLLEAGDESKDRHVGYVQEGTLPAGETSSERAYFVNNLGFEAVGFYFADGTTFSFGADMKEKKLGVFPPNRSLELLLGVEGTFNLKRQN